MKNTLLFIFSTLILVSLLSANANALSTYVGIQILDLTDDPSASCINNVDGDYGPQGRIRALSSILPWHPIYFNLTKQSDNSQIWAGDSTKDSDYTIGDVIFLPNSINLDSGVTYNLFFDIDAIRIYLPLPTKYSFNETINDEYWTAGYIGTGTYAEYYHSSSSSKCDYWTTMNSQSQYVSFLSNIRGNLHHVCMDNLVGNDCDENGYIGMDSTFSSYHFNDWKADQKYRNLYTSSIGNFNLIFVAP